MKSATAINVRSLKDAINLSKKMSKLKSFVYEFSAYSNYANNPIEEKFYELPIDADKLLDLMDSMDEKLIDDITLHHQNNSVSEKHDPNIENVFSNLVLDRFRLSRLIV
uniref:Thioester reductase (TE) domain-containing protein n=1 Tax=Vespula pensylvanica TaxID=30213 RepID=A0A834KEW5_VESPE|nr:hypothetical protein H0235_015180 [Vespula pensylvanica]